MWLFLTFGFFSIVQDRDDSSLLVVRARVRAHLKSLLDRLNVEDAIRHTASADYPYRLTVTRTDFDLFMTGIVQDQIDYFNYKAAAKDLDHRALLDVWSAMSKTEDPGARFRRESPPPPFDERGGLWNPQPLRPLRGVKKAAPKKRGKR